MRSFGNAFIIFRIRTSVLDSSTVCLYHLPMRYLVSTRLANGIHQSSSNMTLFIYELCSFCMNSKSHFFVIKLQINWFQFLYLSLLLFRFFFFIVEHCQFKHIHTHLHTKQWRVLRQSRLESTKENGLLIDVNSKLFAPFEQQRRPIQQNFDMGTIVEHI